MGKAGEPLHLCHLVQFNVQLRLQTIVTGLKKKIHHPSVDFYLVSSVITMWSLHNKTVKSLVHLTLSASLLLPLNWLASGLLDTINASFERGGRLGGSILHWKKKQGGTFKMPGQ